jgi:hypothetical protein
MTAVAASAAKQFPYRRIVGSGNTEEYDGFVNAV